MVSTSFTAAAFVVLSAGSIPAPNFQKDYATAMTAAVVNSKLRWAISSRLYFDETTSPCSVILIRPATVPGGCARIAS